MHSYATNLVDRTRAVYLLAAVAVVGFFVLGSVVSTVAGDLPFYLSTPSSAAFFGLLFAAYDRRLWRETIFGVRLSKLPNLNGVYEGNVRIRSGHVRSEEGGEQVACLVRITQTWSKILFEFDTEFTRSSSCMAVVNGRSGAIYESGLRYEFRVEPKTGSELDGMEPHGGVARLQPENAAWSRLRGDFFNDQGYHRFGEYRLAKREAIELDDWLGSDAS